jgi:hypothetical protein
MGLRMVPFKESTNSQYVMPRGMHVTREAQG